MEIVTRILSCARDHFLKRGVRNVTMDEISGDLGISKKTLYQHFKNKAEIVFHVTKAYLKAEINHSDALTEESSNAIDEEYRILRWTLQVFGNMSPTVTVEIRKYYPRSWRLFEAFRTGHVLKKITHNLQRGIEEGLYRSDLEVDMLSLIRLSQNDLLIDPSYHSIRQVHPTLLSIHLFELYLRGIVSPKGLEVLEAYLKPLREVAQNTRGSAPPSSLDYPTNPV